MVEYLMAPSSGDQVVLIPYDGRWPGLFAQQEAVIRGALGATAVAVHHVGSTSVPGLSAKPVLDVVLEVPDPTDEAAYVPALVATGLLHYHREPEFHEHRVLRRDDPRVNLHVFPAGCSEVARMLAFRDRLRASDADRELYERTKQVLAGRMWARVQDYADAKSAVVADILTRA